MVYLDTGGSTYFSSLCNHSEHVLAKLGFPSRTFNRRKLSRTAFLWCLSESTSLFPAVRSYLVSFECLSFWVPGIIQMWKVLPWICQSLDWTYTSLIFSWNLDITQHFWGFFCGIQLTGCFIPLPLWHTHTRVVPVLAGMLINLAAAF